MFALRLLVPAALAAVLATATAEPAAAASGCADTRADRRAATVVNAAPARNAPRVFAVQMKVAGADVRSRAAFERKVECLLRDHVLPYAAKGRPNVVVFPEDAGLLTGAAGPHGAGARAIAADPAGDAECAGQAFPCRTLHLLRALGEGLPKAGAYYDGRLDGLDGLSAPFVLASDTITRTFGQTFSRAARRHGLYVVAGNFQAPVKEVRTRAAVKALAPKGARSAFVARSAKVFNETLLWGPKRVRRSGPAFERNLLARNRKVPLTGIEQAIGIVAGPSTGPAATRNLRPVRIPGTRARLGFATSLPAFTWGDAGTEPCADVSVTYMRCLDELGANVVVQADANPGSWVGFDGDGIQPWQPLSWMTSTWRTVTDPEASFAYNVTPMLVGAAGDLVFDGQSAITQRGEARGAGCHYVGDAAFTTEDRADLSEEAGPKREFLAIAPWVVADGPRDLLRAVGAKLDPLSGDPLAGDFLETAVAADLPFPVDTSRSACAG